MSGKPVRSLPMMRSKPARPWASGIAAWLTMSSAIRAAAPVMSPALTRARRSRTSCLFSLVFVMKPGRSTAAEHRSLAQRNEGTERPGPDGRLQVPAERGVHLADALDRVLEPALDVDPRALDMRG